MVLQNKKRLKTSPKVGIIILNWNNYADTKEFLESIQKLAYKNYNVAIIDNGSTNQSTKNLEKKFPHYTYIYNKKT